MTGSPIRAPLQNLLFPKSGDTSPSKLTHITHSSSPLFVDMSLGSPTNSQFPEGSFSRDNNQSDSSKPPAKKRCLDLRHQNQQPEKPILGEQIFKGPSQQTQDRGSHSPLTNASSSSTAGEEQSNPSQPPPPPHPIHNGVEGSNSTNHLPQPQQESVSSKDLPQLPMWGNITSNSVYPRISMFPKHFPSMFAPCCTSAIAPGISEITTIAGGDPVPLGASALAAATAMAMSPLFQASPGNNLMSSSWNPMLAAAAAAFASGRFPPPYLPSRFQGDVEGPEEKDEISSLRSRSPMHLSSAGSFVEGAETLPGASQTGHHWTFQEQFKQLYELSSDSKRKEFLDDLFNFMQKRGSPVNRIPIMAKQVLDLYELYRLVVTRGGLVEVINKKLWREITKGLQLPSSITSAAFTLRTQYMKYLYPYECEKLALSTPSELQAAIDGNRREARRSSYSFEYPMLLDPSLSVGGPSGTAEQPLPAPIGVPFPYPPQPKHPLLAPPQLPSPPPPSEPPPPPPPTSQPQPFFLTTCGPSLLPPGLILPPGFSTSNSSRIGNAFSETAFFGFPGLIPPTLNPPTAFDTKSYIDDDQLMKQKQAKCPQRCLSSSSVAVAAVSASPKSRPNSKPNYLSPSALETDWSCEVNRQSKPVKFSNILKCASSFDLVQRPSPHISPSPRSSINVETIVGSQRNSAIRFSEYLKQHSAPTGTESLADLKITKNDQIQQNALQKLGSSEKKNALNGCVDSRRRTKPDCTIRENGDFSGSNLQMTPNLRISTQAGNLLGLPENTLLVCMEVTGVVYQGVLFSQIKPLA